MLKYWLEGPVVTGQQFFITYTDSGTTPPTVYFLTRVAASALNNAIPGATGDVFIFDPRSLPVSAPTSDEIAPTLNDRQAARRRRQAVSGFSVADAPTTTSSACSSSSPAATAPLVITIQGVDTALNLETSTGGTNFLGDVSNVITPSPTLTNYTNMTNQVNPWGLFLAGPEYTLINAANSTMNFYSYEVDTSTPACIVMNGTVPSVTQVTTFRVVPIVWYFNGSKGCEYINSASQNISTTYTAEKSWALGKIGTFQAWTRSTDCDAGIWYSYCGVGVTCGANKSTPSICMGPCGQSNQMCEFVTGTSSSFDCQSQGVELFHSKYFWLTLGILIFIIFVIIVVVILLLFTRNSKKKTT